MMKKITTGLLAVLVVLAMAVFIPQMVKNRQVQQEQVEKNAQLQQEQLERLRPLISEKRALQREASDIQAELDADGRTAGMSAILFQAPSAMIQDDAIKVLNDHNVQGNVLISMQAFPGQEGRLSVEELRELTDAGWELCVPYMAEADMARLLERIAQCGLPAPRSLLLQQEASATALAACIERFGFVAVAYVGQAPGTEADVFELAVYSHREDLTTINAIFDQLQVRGHYAAVTVSYDQNAADYYSGSRMNSILDYCAYYGIDVAPISEVAAEDRQSCDAQKREADLNEKLQEVNRKLDEVQRRIEEVNAQLS